MRPRIKAIEDIIKQSVLATFVLKPILSVLTNSFHVIAVVPEYDSVSRDKDRLRRV